MSEDWTDKKSLTAHVLQPAEEGLLKAVARLQQAKKEALRDQRYDLAATLRALDQTLTKLWDMLEDSRAN
jgi:ABC-type transporter Mla subunit MlaD